MINKIHKFEKAVVTLLNFDGWELKHTGSGFEYYDAEGLTPKGNECIIEMKFRKKYYETKMLEVSKYDNLIKTGKVAIYFVSDPKATYFFWLNDLKNLEVKDMYCPATTVWDNRKIKKPCYLIPENEAALIYKAEETKKGVWDDYFKTRGWMN